MTLGDKFQFLGMHFWTPEGLRHLGEMKTSINDENYKRRSMQY